MNQIGREPSKQGLPADQDLLFSPALSPYFCYTTHVHMPSTYCQNIKWSILHALCSRFDYASYNLKPLGGLCLHPSHCQPSGLSEQSVPVLDVFVISTISELGAVVDAFWAFEQSFQVDLQLPALCCSDKASWHSQQGLQLYCCFDRSHDLPCWEGVLCGSCLCSWCLLLPSEIVMVPTMAKNDPLQYMSVIMGHLVAHWNPIIFWQILFLLK